MDSRINKAKLAGYIQQHGFVDPVKRAAARKKLREKFRALPLAKRALLTRKALGVPGNHAAQVAHDAEVTDFLTHVTQILAKNINTPGSRPRPAVNPRTGMPFLRGQLF